MKFITPVILFFNNFQNKKIKNYETDNNDFTLLEIFIPL